MPLSSKSKTLSVCGGAGGQGTRISSAFLYTSSRGFTLANGVDVLTDEKGTMQNLNNRLASYLTQVSSLEKTNIELERKIKEWYESHTYIEHDHSCYLAIIEDLRDKIYVISKNNARTSLGVDNAKLAADDLKIKYENELAMRRVVEADTASLRQFLDELSLKRSDLETSYERLKEELILLKRSHEEEMSLARAEVGGQVSVSVDAAPSMDLNQAMAEIREHYEAVNEKNREELESWYLSKITTVQQETITHNEELHVSGTLLKDLTVKCHRLQIELQSLHSTREADERTLEEIQARYGAHLMSLQATVTSLEEQLSLFHANIANTKQEYETLLDIKTRLEQEIEEYRRLLNGEESEKHIVFTKTTTVVETIVDGRLVESSEQVDVTEKTD